MTTKIMVNSLNARRKWTLALAVAAMVAAASVAPAAQAQQNPVRALTNVLGWTKDTDDGPDFVRESRPDIKELGFSHVTGVDKPRVAVKTPAELEADKAALIADRDKAEARRKSLQAEKVVTVAPNKAPPIKDE